MILDNTKFEQQNFIEYFKKIQSPSIDNEDYQSILYDLIEAYTVNNLNDNPISIPIEDIEALIEALNEIV